MDITERVIGCKMKKVCNEKGGLEMNTRETPRSFIIRGAAWRLQRFLISGASPEKRAARKENMREFLENYNRLHAASPS